MCFVLDINSFHRAFNPCCSDYNEFKPLMDWLYDNPRTSLVFGGCHYRDELNKLQKYFAHLAELKRSRKLHEISDTLVNEEEKRLMQVLKHRNFDDPHIIAIFCVSGCRIFASYDKRADPFIKMKKLYPKGQKRPSIYRNRSHKSLLRDKNIVCLKNCMT